MRHLQRHLLAGCTGSIFLPPLSSIHAENGTSRAQTWQVFAFDLFETERPTFVVSEMPERDISHRPVRAQKRISD
jgi:hypothetical protein